MSKANYGICASYVAYKEGIPVVDYQDTPHQLCQTQNWQAHSCPTDKDMVRRKEIKRVT